MQPRLTETLHPDAAGLDLRADEEILAALLKGQRAAVAAVAKALPALARGAEMMAATVRAGGVLTYAGAGSSALMALADAAELGGTFGIPAAQVRLHMAGGIPVDAAMPGDTEDDASAAERAAGGLRPGDLLIAVTASGSTPYPLALARAARARGIPVIGIANNRAGPLFDLADLAVCLPTPPELIAGSTRLGAASAQKVALNLMSTLMGIRLGQVHDGMMVGLVADNAKLRARAEAMVAEIAGVGAAMAAQSLSATGGAVKPAVLVARGLAPADAGRVLDETRGNLRAALARQTRPGEAR